MWLQDFSAKQNNTLRPQEVVCKATTPARACACADIRGPTFSQTQRPGSLGAPFYTGGGSVHFLTFTLAPTPVKTNPQAGWQLAEAGGRSENNKNIVKRSQDVHKCVAMGHRASLCDCDILSLNNRTQSNVFLQESCTGIRKHDPMQHREYMVLFALLAPCTPCAAWAAF